MHSSRIMGWGLCMSWRVSAQSATRKKTETHTSQAWKTNHRNWSNHIKWKVMGNKVSSYQDLDTGNESIILLQLGEQISNIFAQVGRTTFGRWRSAKTPVVPFISNGPGFLRRTSGSDCHITFICYLRLPLTHSDFSYHDTSIATISGRECWPPVHFPERRSIRWPLCKQSRMKIPACDWFHCHFTVYSIRLQVAANEYLDRAGISSHAIWLNCDVFFGFFNLTVQVALNFPGPFRWKNQHPSDRTWPRCPCCLLWRWHWLLHRRNGWLLGTARCKAGAIQSCTKCRIYTEEMAWIMATGWRFCWNPGVCCSFKAGYQEHPVTLQDTWRFMTLTPVWPVLKQSVLGCFCCLLSQRHRPPARGVNIQAEPPGESRYGFRHGIRRSKLVRIPSPCIPVTVLTVVSAVG